MQSWSSKAPNDRIQQHKHTKHGAKNDQSRIWAHSRIVQLHCMFSASEYPQICSDYWLFYQLYSPSSLFLKNFANQSRPACAAGTQCASFSTSKITKIADISWMWNNPPQKSPWQGSFSPASQEEWAGPPVTPVLAGFRWVFGCETRDIVDGCETLHLKRMVETS